MRIIINIYIETAVLLILSVITCSGQKIPFIPKLSSSSIISLHSLKVGDTLPDFAISNQINGSPKIISTADLKDCLLLLDFWSMYCSSCIEELPEMEKLQKQFGSKLKILAINQENIAKIKTFWKNNNYVKNLQIPCIAGDTIFSKYFPHKSVPHAVWVYKGKIIGITGADYVDADNIVKVLSGEKINFITKNDFYSFDEIQPLFKIDTSQVSQNSPVEYTAVSGYITGISGQGVSGGLGITRDSLRRTVRIYFLNTGIYSAYALLSISSDLLKEKIRPTIDISPNQIVWNVLDRSRFEYRGKKISGYLPEWIVENTFCFESIHLDTGQTDKEIYRQAIEDLNKLFGLDVRWIRNSERVYVLSKDISIKNMQVLKKGVSVANLVYSMNQIDQGPYFFNEVGEDILLPNELIKIHDPTYLSKALIPYGLRIHLEERLVDKLSFNEYGGLLVNGKQIEEYQRRKTLKISQEPIQSDLNLAFHERNKHLQGVVTLPSGLQYKILQPGSGSLPNPNSRVLVNYTGMEFNGKIFDSTLEIGLPKMMELSNIIPGLRQGLQLMSEGAKWILYIPPSLANGYQGGSSSISPNTTLIFELELLKIIP